MQSHGSSGEVGAPVGLHTPTTTLVLQVRSVPPSDAKVFTEYILPSLSLLPTEAELSVQVGWHSIAWLSTAQVYS